MKHITLKTSIAGIGWSAIPGDTIEVPEEQADRFVLAGIAEHAKPKKTKPSVKAKATLNGDEVDVEVAE